MGRDLDKVEFGRFRLGQCLGNRDDAERFVVGTYESHLGGIDLPVEALVLLIECCYVAFSSNDKKGRRPR
jgi:hypothetical protein